MRGAPPSTRVLSTDSDTVPPNAPKKQVLMLTQSAVYANWRLASPCEQMVGAGRFERPTPCAQGRCATRLRYAPTLYTLDSKSVFNLVQRWCGDPGETWRNMRQLDVRILRSIPRSRLRPPDSSVPQLKVAAALAEGRYRTHSCTSTSLKLPFRTRTIRLSPDPERGGPSQRRQPDSPELSGSTPR